MKKITLKDEDGDFHIYKGDDYRYFEKDDTCRIVKFDAQGNQIPLGTFRNYKHVKVTFDDRADTQPAPAPTVDRYTQAALDARIDKYPDFGTLDKDRPIMEVTGRPAPDPLILDQQAFLKDVTEPSPLVPEEERPRLDAIIKDFGLKKASDLLPRAKPPVQEPAISDLASKAPDTIPAPSASDLAKVYASVKKKWDRDGVDKMSEEDYGKWMGKLDPGEIAALIGQHQAEVATGRVRMEPASVAGEDRAVPKPTPRLRKPRNKRMTVREQMAQAMVPPAPEPDLPDEAEMAAAYQKIAEAEGRHKTRKRMCPACHDTGIVPDPENPGDSVICKSC